MNGRLRLIEIITLTERNMHELVDSTASWDLVNNNNKPLMRHDAH